MPQSVTIVTAIPDPPARPHENRPEWVQGAMERMLAGDYGDVFKRAVMWWAEFERRHLWTTASKNLPTDQRPKEIGNWLRLDRRKLSRTPAINDEAAYAKQWQCWWRKLQPDWREYDDLGHPVFGGEGSWGSLHQPGKNGILMVLLSLMWWKEIASPLTADEWQNAASDVLWVVWQMCTALSTAGCVFTFTIVLPH
ncbi:hypothetical protein PYCCODRAFT_1372698 [Trametes coccinea BRFM310]|uniref:Uncharacterized protein n=1 Tax=Trametes coccinea (strain BRFM310) TaxID=1353009 RepID=A0A1Y2IGG4_TRAC3|nr:hypothetical protein PYCCODRAFT_1372698 [Trametes coccinea BRFM310]